MSEDEIIGLRKALAEAKRSERRLMAQYAVTRTLVNSSTLEDAGQEILQTIGECLDWEMGIFWGVDGVADEQAQALRYVNLWHAEHIEASAFVGDSRERSFQYGEGLIGSVWASGKSVWRPDVVKESNFLRSSLAASAGFHGWVAFPIRKNERVYGIVEFFSHEIKDPDQEILDLMTDVGIKVGQFVDRQQAEDALRESEALAQVARLVGDIGHDINNMLMPMNMATGLLGQAVEDCFGCGPDDRGDKVTANREMAQELIQTIEEGSHRIHSRVKEITDSIKGLTRPPQFRPCRLAEVVASVYKVLRLMAEERQVALKIETLNTLPLIQADENRLFNALYNLVSNAIPEVPPGGSVTVRGGMDPAGKAVSLWVIDTGKGMAPEVRDALFTYRALSRKAGGTGLGTKIVKDVVAAHGGHIQVESEPGAGTSFHIMLPCEPATAGLSIRDCTKIRRTE